MPHSAAEFSAAETRPLKLLRLRSIARRTLILLDVPSDQESSMSWALPLGAAAEKEMVEFDRADEC